MRITHASLSDLDALTELEAACFPEAEAASRESLRARLTAFPECFWLLRDENGEVISMINGMATDEPDLTDEMYEDAGMHDPNGARQMIFAVDTRPASRGNGYALMLMRRVIADCRSRGQKEAVLTCKQALIPFYERLGFACEGVSGSVHGGAVWYAMRCEF